MSASPSSSSPPPLPFDVNNTLGALLVGGLVAAAFWGLTTAQTYLYYQQSTKDRLGLKLVVAFLWILDTLDTFLTSHIVYHYIVVNYMNPAGIAAPVWSALLHIGVTSVTNVLVRSMFAQRIWQLSRHNIVLTATILVISLADLVAGIGATVKSFQLQTWASISTMSGWFYVIFVTGFSGDLSVAVVLCYYLFKSRTGFKSTNNLVNTLISYVIATGLLTSVHAIIGVILYVTMPHNFIFLGFYFSLPKMYINSYLASLNARQGLRDRSDGPVSIHLTRLSDQPKFATSGPSTTISSNPLDAKPSHTNLEIKVQTTIQQTDSYHDSDFHPY